MTESQIVLVSLVRNAVFGLDISLEFPLRRPDWQEVFALAQAASLEGIVFKAIKHMPEDIQPEKAFLNSWKNAVLRLGLITVEKERLIADVFKQMSERGLDAFIFKGYVLAALYPEPYMRSTSDTDIWINSSDSADMEAILSGLGFERNAQRSKKYVSTWVRGINCIEIHQRLWEDYQTRETDILDGFGVTQKEKREIIELRGVAIETMEHTNHLIFQIYHLVKHVTFEGISLRNLIDITLFVNNYASKIDFDRFWESMKALTYESFCKLIFMICGNYFSMLSCSIPSGCSKTEYSEEDFSLFWKYAFKGSAYYGDEIASSAVYQQYYENKKPKVSRSRTVLALLFPKSGSLSFRYEYARKYPVLLPIAWLHRFFNSLFSSEKSGKILVQNAARANEKISFLKHLGLWDKGD